MSEFIGLYRFPYNLSEHFTPRVLKSLLSDLPTEAQHGRQMNSRIDIDRQGAPAFIHETPDRREQRVSKLFGIGTAEVDPLALRDFLDLPRAKGVEVVRSDDEVVDLAERVLTR
jgi:hypothetical protein